MSDPIQVRFGIGSAHKELIQDLKDFPKNQRKERLIALATVGLSSLRASSFQPQDGNLNPLNRQDTNEGPKGMDVLQELFDNFNPEFTEEPN